MATQKSCSGELVVFLWTTVLPTCNYQLQVFIDGQPITSVVVVNNAMTDAQIAALLNGNRINNTTGTFTVQTIGTNLHITLTGIVLSSTAIGIYSATMSGPGFPCPNFFGLSTTLVCSIIPPRKKKRKGALVAPLQFCRRRLIGETCPAQIYIYGGLYTLIYFDDTQCCYKRQS